MKKVGFNPASYLVGVREYVNSKASLEIQAINMVYEREKKEIEKNWIDSKEKTEALRLLKVQSVLDTRKVEIASVKEIEDSEQKILDIQKEQQKKYWEFWNNVGNKISEQNYSIAQIVSISYV